MASTSALDADVRYQPLRHYARSPAVRKSSVIIPRTGARLSDRSYTLRTSSRSNTDASEREPLLGSNGDESPSQRRRRRLGKLWLRVRKTVKSKQTRMVIKCSLAYLLGSLATFIAPISRLLGHYEGKHMVATIAVYFHPARSRGSMHQATIYALIAYLYSATLSVGSMGLSILFGELDMIELGHGLVLLVFCAGGLGLIGYAKQARRDPTVSVCCSLASIAFITILVKEGAIQRAEFEMGKIVQVSLMLFMAVIISNILALLFWPTSAVSELRQLMIESTDTFSQTLTSITRSFLKASDKEIKSSKFVAAAANRRAVFGTMLKSLKDAKYEHYVLGTEQEHHQEKRLIECMQRLAQNIGGLRSAALAQFSLLREFQTTSSVPIASGSDSPADGMSNSVETNIVFTPPDNEPSYSPRCPAGSDEDEENPTPSTGGTSETEEGEEPPPSPMAVFEEFIFHLGPPMKSLAYTLNLTLEELPFGPGPDYCIKVNPIFERSLDSAIQLYSQKRTEALNTLYRNEAIMRNRSLDENADISEVASCAGVFSYNLLFFAEEMRTFLHILIEMQRLQEERPRTWNWLKWWKQLPVKSRRSDEETEAQWSQIQRLTRKETVPNVSPDAKIPRSYKLWKALRVFRKDTVKYSVKVGLGAAAFALPAFIPATRPTFSLWRGEWGLVSYMIIMSMTLGATNNSAGARVTGTVIGAVLAMIAWVIFPGNPYALAIYGWLVSIPCFHIILTWRQATFGRFILLSYNLISLYAYSLTSKDENYGDDEGGIDPLVSEIALHRVVAVTIGVVWGVFVNRMIWPISARLQLRRGLSVLWLRMALTWTRDPLDVLIGNKAPALYHDLRNENALQKDIVRLKTLAANAVHEFRLKGPFPSKEYEQMHIANQSIIDSFHGLRVMISKDPHANLREMAILRHTEKERKDLCTRISHLFYVLGASVRIGFPLPETLPRTDRSRDRLLAKVFEYRTTVKREGERDEGEVDEDFELVYAYILVTGRIAEGLEKLIEYVRVLYGRLEEEMLEL